MNAKYILIAITAVLVGAGIYATVHESPIAVNTETKNPEVTALAQATTTETIMTPKVAEPEPTITVKKKWNLLHPGDEQ